MPRIPTSEDACTDDERSEYHGSRIVLTDEYRRLVLHGIAIMGISEMVSLAAFLWSKRYGSFRMENLVLWSSTCATLVGGTMLSFPHMFGVEHTKVERYVVLFPTGSLSTMRYRMIRYGKVSGTVDL